MQRCAPLVLALALAGCRDAIALKTLDAASLDGRPPPADGASVGDAGILTGDAGDAGGEPPDPGSDRPGPATFRRMTRAELGHTLRDLLGMPAQQVPASRLILDMETESGFKVGWPVSPNDARDLMDVAREVSTWAMQHLDELLPCRPLPTGAAEQEACVDRFITQFGPRAFRRPIDATERAELLDVYREQRSPEGGADFPNAVRVVIEAALQTPQFLYRWETGAPAIKDGPLVRLDGYALASRLSYTLWTSMPDAELFAAAAADRLRTPEQIAAQARRLLADPRASDGVRDFFFQWIDVFDLPERQKDQRFAAWGPEVGQAMLDETGAFLDDLFFAPGATGSLEALFTSTTAFVNEPLAKIYGLPDVTGPTLRRISLDGTRRAGILTRAAFLTANAGGSDSGITRRGLRVFERVLCQVLPPPSNDVPVLPIPPVGLSTRETLEFLLKDGCAKGCHDIYTLGYAFEHYDTIGVHRTHDAGKPVNARGSVKLPSGDLAYDDAIDLARALATRAEVRDCLPRQWLRFTLRRREGPGDAVSLATAGQAFRDTGYDLRELMVALTRTRAFTHRSPSEGEVLP